jgi:peptide/nickel transport system substrate-binding protein
MKRFAKIALAAAMVTTMATSFTAVQAATPPDTLVEAWQFDDMISLDPAEVFEFSAAEIMGNTYERLINYEPDNVSKIYGEVAESWTVSPDGKTFTFKIKPNKKFASGNPITAEDAVFSFGTRKNELSHTPHYDFRRDIRGHRDRGRRNT